MTMDFLLSLPPFLLCLFAGFVTWGITALGAATVFFFKGLNPKALDCMLGLAAGIMLAATFFSLLLPAIEISRELGFVEWVFPAVGFLFGGMFVIFASKLLDKLLFGGDILKKRSLLLVASVTIHNIPEGLCVGVAFGVLKLSGAAHAEIISAILLAVSIAIQNFPEGASISLPLRQAGCSRRRSFFFGQLSGLPEAIFAVIGFFISTTVIAAMPFLLAFAGGAMVAVATAEIMPEATEGENKKLAALTCTIGFVIMMVLDVALG